MIDIFSDERSLIFHHVMYIGVERNLGNDLTLGYGAEGIILEVDTNTGNIKVLFKNPQRVVDLKGYELIKLKEVDE